MTTTTPLNYEQSSNLDVGKVSFDDDDDYDHDCNNNNNNRSKDTFEHNFVFTESDNEQLRDVLVDWMGDYNDDHDCDNGDDKVCA